MLNIPPILATDDAHTRVFSSKDDYLSVTSPICVQNAEIGRQNRRTAAVRRARGLPFSAAQSRLRAQRKSPAAVSSCGAPLDASWRSRRTRPTIILVIVVVITIHHHHRRRTTTNEQQQQQRSMMKLGRVNCTRSSSRSSCSGSSCRYVP